MSTSAPAFEATDEIILHPAPGPVRIHIEVAKTLQEKSMGLMFRRKMAPDHGMLFLYEQTQEISMWMKNTFLPLDMVFIRADGIVHRIESHTEPYSERIITSHGPVRAVLELNAGSADRLQLLPGIRVVHPFFKKN